MNNALIAEFEVIANRCNASGDQLSIEDRNAIRWLVRENGVQSFVDVGTYIGASAESAVTGMDGGRCITIDTFRGSPGEYTENLAEDDWMLRFARKRLARFDNVTIMCGRTPDVAAWFADGSVDMVFLDAAHTYDSVVADIRAWRPKVREGGILAGHDFDTIPEFATKEKMRKFAHLDRAEDNNHYGVIVAVLDEVKDINLFGEEECTVWWTVV